MYVKVRITAGRSAGKELTIRGQQFLIGRSEECNLRPQSDTISRKHCVIEISAAKATIQDLGSRNGTVVNGIRIESATALQVGDELRIGALQLAVVECPQTAPAAAEPVPANQGAKSRSSKPSGSKLTSDSGIISDWLLEADEEAKVRDSTAELETRQYKFDDTDRIALEHANRETLAEDSKVDLPTKAVQRHDEPDVDASGKRKKRKPGKLPTVPASEDGPKDTQEAAAQMLRKFFKRGGG